MTFTIDGCEVVVPPHEVSNVLATPKPTVFLAGSIEMGKARKWQDDLSKTLQDVDVVLYNPRRPDWDSSWKQDISNPHFVEQVSWELDHMRDADHIVMYFDPTTMSPITLLELGLCAGNPDEAGKLIVCCPEGYHRRGNVEVVCERAGIPFMNTFADLVVEICIHLCVKPTPELETAIDILDY
jgi:hypothetical protein